MIAKIAEGLGAIVIRHGRNMGHGAVLASLFKKTGGADVAVTADTMTNTTQKIY